ncbi:MAG: hypothetical protein U0796_19915 [Gemmatales bacterium]
MTKLNCLQAEQSIQQLLDERAGHPLPQALSDHLAHCPQCQSWQSLFHLPLPPLGNRVPTGFANRVIERHQWEQRKQRWLRYGSMLALAACLLIAIAAWYVTQPGVANVTNASVNELAAAKEKSRRILSNLQDELASIPKISYPWQVPSITVPDMFTELPGMNDPLSIGMPAIRTIGNTFQNTIEPLEAPAKAAYDKVKSVIDDPELRKLMSRISGRST